MRRIALAFILLLVVSPIYAQLSVDVYVSPHGGCTTAIVKELGKATSTVRVQAFSFTSARIAKALNEASDPAKRKVDVKMILDKGHQTETEINDKEGLLASPAISVMLDGNRNAEAHSKVIIIDPDLDSAVVITGSFDFTGQAENSNVENLLIIRDKKIAQKYLANWNDRAEHHAVPYVKATPAGNAKANAKAEQDGFVASAQSKVFHRPDCKYVARIAEKNLVHYATREEAIKAGKRPCAECEP